MDRSRLSDSSKCSFENLFCSHVFPDVQNFHYTTKKETKEEDFEMSFILCYFIGEGSTGLSSCYLVLEMHLFYHYS